MTKHRKEALRWVVPVVLAIGIISIIAVTQEEQQEPTIDNDQVTMYRADEFIIHAPPDTLTFVIVRAIDDNVLELRCIEDSTYHKMVVESCYTPQHWPGNTFTMIKPITK